MNSHPKMSGLCWDRATSMRSTKAFGEQPLQCALVPDTVHDCDQVAVVYNKGDAPPEITIREISGFVHTVLADGVAVAVIARASGPVPRADDVLLVERSV